MRISSDPAARRRLAILVGTAIAALIAGLEIGAGSGDDAAEPRGERGPAQQSRQEIEGSRAPRARRPVETSVEPVDRLSLRQQVGQLTVSSFEAGPLPGYVRRRLRAGETAGVILFGFNAATRGDWRRLTSAVQRPAHGRALVMVDQEGGDVQTVAFAGPPVGQPLQGDPAAVRRGARAAARRLRDAGVNVNLAPVADVPGGAAPVMGSRAFAGTARAIAARTRASIEGMGAAGVGATAKHFPGLGRARVNTDDGSAVVGGDLTTDLVPFRAAIEAGVPLVMLSHALYPAVDPSRIASQSPAIVSGLLRDELGFDGVIVTDSVEAQAVLDRSGVARAAERSIRAGADVILMTGSASWNAVHPWLMRRARASEPFRERVRRSAARVLAMKERLGLLD